MALILEALHFPLLKSSLRMLSGLCILFIMQFWVQWVPVVNLIGIAFLGYIYSTQFKIIFTTGNGYPDAPAFPDFSDVFDNILIPLIKVALIWIFAFLPSILSLWLLQDPSNIFFWCIVALGFCYLPIGLMIAAMDEITKAFNPIVIVASIRKAGTGYVMMVIAYGLFTILKKYLDESFAGSWVFSSLLSAYGIMFTARLIGGVFRDRLADEFAEPIETVAEPEG